MAFAENELPSSWLPEARDAGSRCFQVMIRRVGDAIPTKAEQDSLRNRLVPGKFCLHGRSYEDAMEDLEG